MQRLLWNQMSLLLHYSVICLVYVRCLLALQHANGLNGHLKPLFAYGRRLGVASFDGFPEVDEFFDKNVKVGRPVLFRGGAALYPAYYSWNEEYFLSFPESEESLVTVELEKKENRTLPGEDIPFADFIRELHSSTKYVVSPVPAFLRQDVLVPPCIACEDIVEGNLIQDMLWYSSGGTKSVLHNDYAENIMCVFQGTKEFFLIDRKYQDQVNVTEMGYSTVDVDRVDLEKYPGLYNIEYYYAFLKPGDCLYVPFLWIHHVRSYDVNLAVNIWWRHGITVDFSSCDLIPGRTIKEVSFVGFGSLHEAQEKMIKNRLILEAKSRRGQMSVKDLQELFSKPDVLGPDVRWTENMKKIIQKLFILMDRSSDEFVSSAELEHLQKEDWKEIRMLVKELSDTAEAGHDEYLEQHEDYIEEQDPALQTHIEL